MPKHLFAKKGGLVQAYIQRAYKNPGQARFPAGLVRPKNPIFRAEIDEDEAVATISLYDIIGTYETNAQTFRDMLSEIDTDVIKLRINSPGGSVFDGLAMYQDLVDHPARVEVEITGLAASIASIVALAGDTVEIAENAFLMIHNSWNFAVGDRRELEKVAKTLASIDKRMARAYAKKAETTTPEEFAKLMDDETWFDSDEAVEIGLADRVIGIEPEDDEVAIEPGDDEETAVELDDEEIAIETDENEEVLSCYRNTPRVLRQHKQARRAARPMRKTGGADITAALQRLKQTLRRGTHA